MPTGICAYPYPMGEPEVDDLEARALDEQLVTAYSALEPQPGTTTSQCGAVATGGSIGPGHEPLS